MDIQYAYARIRTMFMSMPKAGAWAEAHGHDWTTVVYGKYVASLRAARKRK